PVCGQRCFHSELMPPTTSSLSSFPAPTPSSPSPLSLHDALPIYCQPVPSSPKSSLNPTRSSPSSRGLSRFLAKPLLDGLERVGRSEEHTSELQSLRHLVCRLLLEKKD